ncbi:uncharacterized protein LOC134227587 [Armigeres subalbatus]|uniref:uncharacterized protein LOC134227587 n=1 Tax=Armigeres subalbatus TaxID=124917 RepID=UPI002ED38C72
MADQPKEKNYHNDAAKAPTKSGSGSKMSKKDRKMTKLEKLTCKLEAEKAEMAEQLKKMQAEMEAMKSGRGISSTPDKDVVEQDSVDFAVVPCASSTRHGRTIGTAEESRFLCSVNQLSVSSITIPECKPAEGDDEIHRRTYEMWKDLLTDSLTLAGIEDEMTKFIVFKVKAGSRLLSIFKNTKSDDEAPDATTCPFSNALHRLKLYFGSGSDVMFQRRKLSLMEQRPEESDLAFITRVGDTAQLCDYDKTKEFEEIVKTVAEHAKCKEVRVTALKMVSRNGTFTDLVDKVREIQAIRMNEEFFEAKYGRRQTITKEAMLAPDGGRIKLTSRSEETRRTGTSLLDLIGVGDASAIFTYHRSAEQQALFAENVASWDTFRERVNHRRIKSELQLKNCQKSKQSSPKWNRSKRRQVIRKRMNK